MGGCTGAGGAILGFRTADCMWILVRPYWNQRRQAGIGNAVLRLVMPYCDWGLVISSWGWGLMMSSRDRKAGDAIPGLRSWQCHTGTGGWQCHTGTGETVILGWELMHGNHRTQWQKGLGLTPPACPPCSPPPAPVFCALGGLSRKQEAMRSDESSGFFPSHPHHPPSPSALPSPPPTPWEEISREQTPQGEMQPPLECSLPVVHG